MADREVQEIQTDLKILAEAVHQLAQAVEVFGPGPGDSRALSMAGRAKNESYYLF